MTGSRFPTISPQNFLNFISCFKNVLVDIFGKSDGQTSHLNSGLEKLRGAERDVDKLSSEAVEKKKKLSVAQAEANKSMQKIQVSMEQKAARKTEVEALQSQCNKDAQVIEKRKQDVEHELSGV